MCFVREMSGTKLQRSVKDFMSTINISRCKLLRVKFILSNGIDQEEHYFKIEPHQPDFNTVEAGNFVLLASNFKNNLVTFGKIIGVICNSKQIDTVTKNENNIPRAIKTLNFNEEELLDLVEGIEEVGQD